MSDKTHEIGAGDADERDHAAALRECHAGAASPPIEQVRGRPVCDVPNPSGAPLVPGRIVRWTPRRSLGPSPR